MSSSTPTPPPKATVAAYLTEAIDNSPKTQREIAKAIGYINPNIITMFKQGLTKVPLDKVPLLAEALGRSPIELMRIALREYSPHLIPVFEQVFGRMVSDNEFEIVAFIRSISHGSDPRLASDRQKRLLTEAFAAAGSEAAV